MSVSQTVSQISWKRCSDPRTNDDSCALRTRAATLAAATELLAEGGPENVTHATVTQRAGIGRATVYRHWPDRQTLLIAALAGGVRPLFAFDDSPSATS
ncbi:TetR/AcrR family transcriptional regulator [Streptomyces aurantiogriseus]|uniref:HTH tetR-type domain-containing protein n=1 Tax=Streptomyces aurantiogriseus TaxID=66870 RepID=A0A918C7E0_9ACTN|nr:TetR/AcrR family transcriptional regulator [Streptomyces aurantiogriseus]GGR08532.1 hypothetical protein GCM10010251_25190 [Streptomyces aurantiogriseus]